MRERRKNAEVCALARGGKKQVCIEERHDQFSLHIEMSAGKYKGSGFFGLAEYVDRSKNCWFSLLYCY